MTQKDLNNNQWEEINAYDDESEILKLAPGETISGILQDKYPSKKYTGHNIYKIKPQEGVCKVILGTTVLDTKLSSIELGDIIMIRRDSDKKNDSGQTYQDYRVFKRKKVE
ncbi:MAG: hypothetical protein R6V50_04015 [Thermoplasmatota archaeon]